MGRARKLRRMAAKAPSVNAKPCGGKPDLQVYVAKGRDSDGRRVSWTMLAGHRVEVLLKWWERYPASDLSELEIRAGSGPV